MKKQLLFLIVTIFAYSSYSQAIFEQGYFINNNNQKINCLIKNIDWKNNPTEFRYKVDELETPKTITIKYVKEFEIYNKSKFIRSTVMIDKSSNSLNSMSEVRKPEFKEEELFLRVLVEGKANLYSYVKGGLFRFFYKKDDLEIKQLIYKKYLASASYLSENMSYKQQLKRELNCGNINDKTFNSIAYKNKNLIDFFNKYNICNNSTSNTYINKEKRERFNLSIKVGFSNASLSIDNGHSDTRDVDFGNKSGLRFGVEAEFVLPFNNNKWSIIIEPTYQNYKNEEILILNPGGLFESEELVKVDYKSIEIPIGVRHYFFLNNNSKIFVNAAYIFDIRSESKIDFQSYTDLEISTWNNYALGLGYKFRDKYSVELRYHSDRNILNNFVSWDSEYKTTTLLFGYTIF